MSAPQAISSALPAPFRVLIHGDLNSDNIIYDPRQDRIHFVDLYRTAELDYVQDVSVFLVSNFRIPVFEGVARELLNAISLRMLSAATQFAEEHDDHTFHARLALGLARSFITSTRFEIDEDFARTMFMRAVYLLEKVALFHQQEFVKFRLSPEVITH